MENKNEWQTKLHTLQKQYDAEKQVWSQSEDLLRRSITRIAKAANINADSLKALLERIHQLNANSTGLIEAENELNELIGILNKEEQRELDTSTENNAAFNKHFRTELLHPLIQLLGYLDTPKAFEKPAKQLQKQIKEPTQRLSDIKENTHQIAEIIGKSIELLQSKNRGLEHCIEQITSGLHEFGSIVEETKSQTSNFHNSGQKIHQQLGQKVTEISNGIHEFDDIEVLQGHMAQQLNTLSHQIQYMVSEEEKRLSIANSQNEKLTEKLNEMEQEAANLRSQLIENQQLLLRDTLTGVNNRLAYEERIKLEIARYRREKTPLSLAGLDIDHFKKINDTFGHKAGDRVLRLVAQLANSQIRATDFFARVGGEEFVLILPNTSVDGALHICDKIRQYIEAYDFRYGEKPVQVNISCGVTQIHANEDEDDLYQRADKALYEAKNTGRNRCVAIE